MVSATAFDCVRDVPRTGDPVGGLAAVEGLLGDVAGDRGLEQAVVGHLLQALGGSDASPPCRRPCRRRWSCHRRSRRRCSHRRRCRAGTSGRRRPVSPICSGERQRGLLVLDQRLALGDQVVQRGRALGRELRVGQQGDVLDRVGHAVVLAVVGHGLDRDLAEARGLGAQVDRGHDTVGDQLAEPVVGTDEQVGHVAGLVALDDLGADVAEVDLDDVAGDAVGLGELVALGLDRGGPRSRRPRW